MFALKWLNSGCLFYVFLSVGTFYATTMRQRQVSARTEAEQAKKGISYAANTNPALSPLGSRVVRNAIMFYGLCNMRCDTCFGHDRLITAGNMDWILCISITNGGRSFSVAPGFFLGLFFFSVTGV